MTSVRLKGMLAAIIAASVMAACGGGGGGVSVSASPASATMTMTVYTTALTATAYGTSGIGGIGLSILMPAGVSVSTTNGSVDSTVAVASGVAQGIASVIAVYSAASATLPGKLDIVSSSTEPAGFGVGEFLTVNIIVSSGTPTVGSFSIADFSPVNTTNYAPITGLGFTTAVK